MDISVVVPRLPGPGMTVLGSAARFTAGGKGANQAVAAARLGADVRMAGRVGGDDFGRRLVAGLQAEGIDAGPVRSAAATPSGLAMISVDGSGENLITVAPGANHEVGDTDVAAAFTEPGDVVVISAEIPVPAIRAALARARGAVPCMLNLAPAPQPAAEAAAIVADGVDWLVVNEPEAAAVLGKPVRGLAGAARAAAGLLAAGARNAVVTAGSQGAALAGAQGSATVPGFSVAAVDATGAGDTFVGALAVAIAAGVPAADAVRAAAAAAAAAVTRYGAQAAMPRPADIRAVTGLAWPLA
ncbi:MAG: bifunctional hydroxymethylpyrimidine kinase/phosphomethylpyrimidine kinase [Streptosporangiaceae bacterium]|nr:bifunctional hydroxymethylpyrimidine kinase/phosphomethylpyrimidine kinase [Streptosporangiaceae bacterium]